MWDPTGEGEVPGKVSLKTLESGLSLLFVLFLRRKQASDLFATMLVL